MKQIIPAHFPAFFHQHLGLVFLHPFQQAFDPSSQRSSAHILSSLHAVVATFQPGNRGSLPLRFAQPQEVYEK